MAQHTHSQDCNIWRQKWTFLSTAELPFFGPALRAFCFVKRFSRKKDRQAAHNLVATNWGDYNFMMRQIRSKIDATNKSTHYSWIMFLTSIRHQQLNSLKIFLHCSLCLAPPNSTILSFFTVLIIC